MPTNDRGIRDITERVVCEQVRDRIRLTLVSGRCGRPYSLPFHEARQLQMDLASLLDEHDREARKVLPFG